MSEPRESMTAFVTSDVLDHDSLQTFLAAQMDGCTVQWRGICWQIRQHETPSGRNGQHSFWLSSVPKGDCL